MSVAKLCTNGYWAVDGTPLYVPSEVDISHDNIVTSDSGRTESGYMHMTFVRNGVRTVSFTFDRLTAAECEYMRNLVQGKDYVLTYYDNGIQTMHAYTGKNDYSQTNLSVYTEEGGLYKSLKFNCVEM